MGSTTSMLGIVIGSTLQEPFWDELGRVLIDVRVMVHGPKVKKTTVNVRSMLGFVTNNVSRTHHTLVIIIEPPGMK